MVQQRAEAHLAVGVRSGVIVQLHREADDLVPLTSEQCGGDRRIDAAGHGDDYTHFLPGGFAPRQAPRSQELAAATIALASCNLTRSCLRS